MGRLVKRDLSARLVYVHTFIYFTDKPKEKNNMLVGNEWVCESFLLRQSPTLRSLSQCPLSMLYL